MIRRTVFATVLLLAALLVSASQLNAQGCTQCRDNSAAAPPQTQAAFRHAIILLVAAAGTLFVGTIVLLKRSH